MAILHLIKDLYEQIVTSQYNLYGQHSVVLQMNSFTFFGGVEFIYKEENIILEHNLVITVQEVWRKQPILNPGKARTRSTQQTTVCKNSTSNVFTLQPEAKRQENSNRQEVTHTRKSQLETAEQTGGVNTIWYLKTGGDKALPTQRTNQLMRYW